MIPPLGHKFIHLELLASAPLRGIDVLPSLHHQRRVSDWGPLQYPHRLIPIRPATMRERGIFQRDTHIKWNHGIQPQRLIQHVLEIPHVLQVLIRRCSCRAHPLEDLSTESGERVGIPRQLAHAPGQRAGGGVAARKKGSNQLVPNDSTIPRRRRQRVQKGVPFIRLGLLLELSRRQTQRVLDELVHEGIQRLQVFPEGATRDEGVEGSRPRDQGLRVLDLGEGVREFLRGLREAVDRVAEEEVGGGVEGEAEEEVGDVDRFAAAAGERGEEDLGVALEAVEVGDAVFDEEGAEELAGP